MISMKAVKAVASAIALTWGVDTLQTVGAPDFAKLADARVAWRAGYIEKTTAAELQAQLAAGIAFLPVTYALDFNAASHVAKLQALGIPKGVTIFLDIEGQNLDPTVLIGKINAWAFSIRQAGYDPGMNVGAGCPLSDAQLYALDVDRYWHSCSRVPDPKVRGCCVRQLRPNDVTPTGLDVDVDVVEPDYEGDVPTLAAAA